VTCEASPSRRRQTPKAGLAGAPKTQSSRAPPGFASSLVIVVSASCHCLRAAHVSAAMAREWRSLCLMVADCE